MALAKLAYDEALRGTRGNLATAFHRNVFQERRDVERSKLLERYVRRELDCLSLTKSAAIFEGRIQFSDVRIFQKLSEAGSANLVKKCSAGRRVGPADPQECSLY